MVTATGQIPTGDLGIWSPTDSSGTQACSAAELNYLMSSDASRTQFVLAIAAEIQFLAGSNFPTTAGTSYDVTAPITQLFASASGGSSPITFKSVSVTHDGTSYFYSASFSVPNSAPNASGNVNCFITLKHTPGASSSTYSGVAGYQFDDGTTLVAGTTRYQRTGPTHLDISARDTFYQSGVMPQVDANDAIDPNDPNFIMRFSRIGASFDPTSALTPGSFLFALQINASGVAGPTTASGILDIFQLMLTGDGTGSAYYGFGAAAMNEPTAWQVTGTPTPGAAVGTIDHIYCNRATRVSHLYAQFQPLSYDSTSGQYVPSASVPAQIRFAPTASCIYTDAQWNNGVAGGFWYDRKLQSSTAALPPPAPSPIPQYVVPIPTTPIIPSASLATAPPIRKP